jgi:hypothetical protein
MYALHSAARTCPQAIKQKGINKKLALGFVTKGVCGF